jgi:hypothetical protein
LAESQDDAAAGAPGDGPRFEDFEVAARPGDEMSIELPHPVAGGSVSGSAQRAMGVEVRFDLVVGSLYSSFARDVWYLPTSQTEGR